MRRRDDRSRVKVEFLENQYKAKGNRE